MKSKLLTNYIDRFKDAETTAEIDKVLDGVIPLLLADTHKSLPQIALYLKMHSENEIPNSRIPAETTEEDEKARLIMERLLAKMLEMDIPKEE